MTERRMRELAAEARERHKDDPAFERILLGQPGSTKGTQGAQGAVVKTPSEAFWYWWNSWINKKASMHAEHSLAYKGQNDPTANTAIGMVMREMKEMRGGDANGSSSGSSAEGTGGKR